VVLPKKAQFIIIDEPTYFDMLFCNFEECLLDQIKPIYENQQPGLFG
jgi:hypothetical protein